MVLKIENKEFFKEVNYKPANDTDGGGDIVDGVDSVDGDKFNRRWNSNDKMLLDMQRFNERVISSLKTIKQMGLLYEGDITKDLLSTFKPFEKQITTALGLDFGVLGMPSVLFINDKDNIVLPNGKFVENLEIGNEQFVIAVGNTDLFEIQEDATGTKPDRKLNSNKRWYRLGHTGAESVPAAAIARHTLSSSAVWAVVDIKFEDYQNNPTTKNQIIRIKGNTHNEYIEFVLDPDQSNYRINAALWDGGALQTYLDQDTGVARSSAEHSVLFLCNKHTTEVWLDGSLVFTKTAEVIQNTDVLEFETENDSGGADFFDIQRFNVYETNYFTLTANNRWFVYIDRTDSTIKATTTKASISNNILLYDIDLPLGVTEILAANITDYRDFTEFVNNINLKANDIDSLNATITNLLSTDIITDTIQSNVNPIIITNITQLTDWLSSQSNGDFVIITGDFTYSLSVDITVNDVNMIISRGVQFSNSFTISGDRIIVKGGYYTYATGDTVIISGNENDFSDAYIKVTRTTITLRGAVKIHNLRNKLHDCLIEITADNGVGGEESAILLYYENNGSGAEIYNNKIIMTSGTVGLRTPYAFNTTNNSATGTNNFWSFVDNEFQLDQTQGKIIQIDASRNCKFNGNLFTNIGTLVDELIFTIDSTTSSDGDFLELMNNKIPDTELDYGNFENAKIIGNLLGSIESTNTLNYCIISNNILNDTLNSTTILGNNCNITSNFCENDLTVSGTFNVVTDNHLKATFTLTVQANSNAYVAGNIVDNLTSTGAIPSPSSSHNKIY